MSDPRDNETIRAAWDEWNRNTPESFWDVFGWTKHRGGICVSLDVANRFEIWAHAYAAGRSDALMTAADECDVQQMGEKVERANAKGAGRATDEFFHYGKQRAWGEARNLLRRLLLRDRAEDSHDAQ